MHIGYRTLDTELLIPNAHDEIGIEIETDRQDLIDRGSLGQYVFRTLYREGKKEEMNENLKQKQKQKQKKLLTVTFYL